MATKTCLRCSHYMGCADENKSFSYRCSSYREDSDSKFVLSLGVALEKTRHPLFASGGFSSKEIVEALAEDSAEWFKADKAMEKIVNEKRLVSPDVRIPEDDFAKAPNFYTWCKSDKFLKQTPYLVQAIMGTILFGEYCPCCSDKHYIDGGYKVDDSLARFERKVVLLEHGVCPSCKRTKNRLKKKYGLKNYREFAAACGQRCVVADTLVLTDDGLIEIGDYAENRPFGYSDMAVGFHTGDAGVQNCTRFYKAYAETCFRVRTKHGFSITGTKDHPVMTYEGFKKLPAVTEGGFVRIYYGQKLFGNKSVLLKDVTDKTNVEYDIWLSSVKSCVKHRAVKPRRRPGCGRDNEYTVSMNVARLLGYWVSEGRYRSISNDDPVILDDCYDTLTRMFGDVVIRRTKNTIEFSNTYVQMWLGNLLKSDIKAGSARKSVPACILQASKDVQASFLSALFEGDGGVVNGSTTYVEYTTISKNLAQHLSAMLLNFGVIHSVRTKKTWAANGSAAQKEKTAYVIAILGSAIQVFKNEIGFTSERKSRLLDEAVTVFNARTNDVPFYFEKLPPQAQDLFYTTLREVQEQLNALNYRGSSEKMVGLRSVFGEGHRAFTREDRQRSITKRDIETFILPLLSSDFCFSAGVNGKLNELAEIASTSYFYDEVVSNKQTSNKHETYDVTIPGAHRFISNGILSHNSGKSAFAGMCFSYLSHRHIKLIRPTEVYGVMDSEIFHGTFVALTFKQAFDTLWTNYHGALMDSPWFSSYHEMLLHSERKYGDGSLFRLKDTFVLYRHRSLYVYPAAPDIRTLRGRSRVFGGVDEIGWMPTGGQAAGNVKLNAEEIYKAMERSLLTVRAAASKHFRMGQPDVPSGFFINISSPSSPRDKIMSLVNDSQLSEYIYGINKPTWEMNPHIGREDLAPEFDKDHIAAMRDYGAQPPLTGSPFISNPDTISESFGKNKNGLKLAHHTIRSSKKDIYEIFSSVERIKHGGQPSVVAIDAGVVNNSFAFALGHLSKDHTPVISMVGEIIPHAGMRINYSMAFRRFLVPIIEGCNVKLLAADRWNSLKILSDAAGEFDIETIQYSLKYKDIIMLRSYMEDGSIIIPRPSTEDIEKILKFEQAKYPLCFRDRPADHLVVQLMTVQDTGSAVIKGDGLTDDIARAVMLCVNQLVDEANLELLSGPAKSQLARIDITQMAIYKGLSGGGSSGQTGGGGVSPSGKAIGFLKT